MPVGLQFPLLSELKRSFFSFGVVEGEKTSALYTLANPMGRAGKQLAYLQKWSVSEGELTNAVAFDESVSALAVRDDGRFVAVGTMFSGSVSIYIAFSLQVKKAPIFVERLLNVWFQKALHVQGAHSMFVTGLEFLPVSSDDLPITSLAEAAVLSISVDNQVCIHSLYYRRKYPERKFAQFRNVFVLGTMPPLLAIVIIVIVLFFTFLLCSYLGI